MTAPLVPSSSLGGAISSAGSAFSSAGSLFFTFCQVVGLVLAARGFYMVYEMGDDRHPPGTGWVVIKLFLVATTIYYLDKVLMVLHNTFPGLFPSI